jgi:predicted transcriptional regulator YdeE
MDPVMETRDPFAVLGVQTEVTRASESPGLFAAIWRQFEAHQQEIESLSIQDHYFGVSFPTGREDVTDYFAGMMVSPGSPQLQGLRKRGVPGGHFAVFECSVEGIGSRYREIFTEWLPHASVRFEPTVPLFEEYPGKSSSGPVARSR